MKKCTRCNETKPLDSFSLSKTGRQGKHSICKLCCTTYTKAQVANTPKEVFIAQHESCTYTHKVCTSCGVDTPLEGYTKAFKARDGRMSICKTCEKEVNRKKYLARKERLEV